MKRTLPAGLVFLFLFASNTSTQAQGWLRHKKMLMARGVGLTHLILLPERIAPKFSSSKIGLSFNISTEHKVSRCIGLGIQTGMNIFFGSQYTSITTVNNERKNVRPIKETVQTLSYALPIGGRILVHLLDALYVPGYVRYDVYYGFAIGAGPVFTSGEKVRWFVYAGPVTGVRYRFGKMSLFAELGYGANFFNCGVVF